MEVIGAGWGRTGTLSLKEALDTLGLPCYHMLEVINTGDEKKWLAAAEGEPVDFAQVLSDYKACVDLPAASFYKELMEVYPDAKVILSVRDPVKWYNSAKTTIWKLSKVLIETPWYARTVMGSMVDKLVWQRDLQGWFEEDPHTVRHSSCSWSGTNTSSSMCQPTSSWSLSPAWVGSPFASFWESLFPISASPTQTTYICSTDLWLSCGHVPTSLHMLCHLRVWRQAWRLCSSTCWGDGL